MLPYCNSYLTPLFYFVRYHCQDGYTIRRLHGQVIYRCTSNGEWSPKVPPVCIKSETHDTYNGMCNIK